MTAFDLFAGVGGFRAGAAESAVSNVRFLGACEIDRRSVDTYRAMHAPGDEFFLDDIQSITRGKGGVISTGLEKNVRARIRDVLPEFSLLTAGFPCQAHSLMGNRKGVEDHRGSLFYDIAAVIRAMQPESFVLENVRALKSVNGGALYRSMQDVLETELGYNMRIWELNACDFGVPQVRRRLFFVGSRMPLPMSPPPPVSLETAHYPTAWHLLDRAADSKYYLSSKILKTILKDQHKGYSRKADINRLIARPLTRTMHKMHRASQDNYYSDSFINGRFDSLSRCVAPDVREPDGIRRITPREAFRIQSFPDEMIERALGTGVSDTQLYMQAGNAVPPLLVKAVIDHAFGNYHAEPQRHR